MSRAGLFSGTVTESAPADNAPTTKHKGHHWMQWGEAIPVPYQPLSGEGHTFTQDGYVGPPNFPHPFANQSYNEWTQSVVFTPQDLPIQTENAELFNIMYLGDKLNFYVRRRPTSGQLYFGFNLSTKHPSLTDAISVSSSVHEITLDHPGWTYQHWYWIAASYDNVGGSVHWVIRNLTLGQEAIKAVSITNQLPITWTSMPTGQSFCIWGTGIALDNLFLGVISQLVLHNKYIDLSVEANRDKFCGIDGVIDIGDNGENIFGEIPLVHLPRGFPQENTGTLFIGDPSDFHSPVEISRDLILPPVAS